MNSSNGEVTLYYMVAEKMRTDEKYLNEMHRPKFFNKELDVFAQNEFVSGILSN